MTDIDRKLLAILPECQKMMREVGDLLRAKSCRDWQQHGDEIHGAAGIIDSWINGITEESEEGTIRRIRVNRTGECSPEQKRSNK